MEEFLSADDGKIEGSGKHRIEIEKGERRNEKVRLVDVPEVHRSDSRSSHHDNSGQYHSEKQCNRHCSQVSLHDAFLRFAYRFIAGREWPLSSASVVKGRQV